MFPRPPQRRPYKAPPFLIGHQGYPGAFCYVQFGAWCNGSMAVSKCFQSPNGGIVINEEN